MASFPTYEQINGNPDLHKSFCEHYVNVFNQNLQLQQCMQQLEQGYQKLDSEAHQYIGHIEQESRVVNEANLNQLDGLLELLSDCIDPSKVEHIMLTYLVKKGKPELEKALEGINSKIKQCDILIRQERHKRLNLLHRQIALNQRILARQEEENIKEEEDALRYRTNYTRWALEASVAHNKAVLAQKKAAVQNRLLGPVQQPHLQYEPGRVRVEEVVPNPDTPPRFNYRPPTVESPAPAALPVQAPGLPHQAPVVQVPIVPHQVQQLPPGDVMTKDEFWGKDIDILGDMDLM